MSLNEPTPTSDEGLEAIVVQWLNVTSNGTISQIPSNNRVSVGNLIAVRLDQYMLSLTFLEVETYHSGEYACQAENDGIIRKNTITISVNRMSQHNVTCTKLVTVRYNNIMCRGSILLVLVQWSPSFNV